MTKQKQPLTKDSIDKQINQYYRVGISVGIVAIAGLIYSPSLIASVIIAGSAIVVSTVIVAKVLKLEKEQKKQ